MPRDDLLEMRHRNMLENKLDYERGRADEAARQYHEALEADDGEAAAETLDRYAHHVRAANELAGALNGPATGRQNDGLHQCERQWLARNSDYLTDPTKSAMLTGYVNSLIASGMTRGSDEIMQMVEQKFGKGDGLPSDAEAAKICGIPLEDYERGKQRLAVLKSQGHYQDH